MQRKIRGPQLRGHSLIVRFTVANDSDLPQVSLPQLANLFYNESTDSPRLAGPDFHSRMGGERVIVWHHVFRHSRESREVDAE